MNILFQQNAFEYVCNILGILFMPSHGTSFTLSTVDIP